MRAGASKSALLAPPSQIGAKSYRLIKRLGGHSNLDWAAVARLLEQSSYFSTRQVQKMHVARLKFPGPATEETWVTDADGDPVFMVIAKPSQSLAGQLRGLLPQLRQVVGDGRRVTVCFDRGGWSPALFADITAAGFDLLTYRKGPVADLPGSAFTSVACTDDRGRSHEHELADTTVALAVTNGTWAWDNDSGDLSPTSTAARLFAAFSLPSPSISI